MALKNERDLEVTLNWCTEAHSTHQSAGLSHDSWNSESEQFSSAVGSRKLNKIIHNCNRTGCSPIRRPVIIRVINKIE